jgi:MraZ protein
VEVGEPGSNEGNALPVKLTIPNVADVEGPVYLGRFAHTLDDKRRVAIPKTYREQIDPVRDGESYYVMQALDPCLWLFTEKRFDAFRKRLAGETNYAGVGDSRVRALRRELFSRCEKLTPDKQGRISLSLEICGPVGINRDVVFCGVEEKVELWSPAREEVKDDPERLERLSKEIMG